MILSTHHCDKIYQKKKGGDDFNFVKKNKKNYKESALEIY